MSPSLWMLARNLISGLDVLLRDTRQSFSRSVVCLITVLLEAKNLVMVNVFTTFFFFFFFPKVLYHSSNMVKCT